MRRLIVVVISAFLCAAISCSSGGGGSDDSNGDQGGSDVDDGSGADQADDVQAVAPPAGAGLLKVTSWNVGLLPNFVPRTDERVAPVAAAAAAHDTDVLCLQEVWRESDQNTLRNALQSRFPYFAIPPARQKLSSNAPVCSASDLEPVATCALANCLLGASGLYECFLGTCHDEVEQLAAKNPECAEAITAQEGASVLELSGIQDLVLGSQPVGLFAFGGSPGIVLASKLPLDNVQVVDFFDISTTSRRVAVLATVTKDGIQHRVGCTHLQSNLDGLIPYTGTFSSWGEEQRAQASRLRQVALQYSGTDPQYLSGDFNCSLASASGVVAELENTCRVFTDGGYSDPAGAQIGCTFCSANLLNQENSSIAETRDVLLDHVFMRNVIYTGTQANRVFTEQVSAGGSPTNLSDHFGLRIDVPVP